MYLLFVLFFILNYVLNISCYRLCTMFLYTSYIIYEVLSIVYITYDILYIKY